MEIGRGFLGVAPDFDFEQAQTELEGQHLADQRRAARVQALRDMTIFGNRGTGTVGENVVGNLGKTMQGAQVARDLADPGVRPIMEEGATPFNVGMLALGSMPVFGKATSAAVRAMRRAGVDDVVRAGENKFRFLDGEDVMARDRRNGFFVSSNEIQDMYGDVDNLGMVEIADLDPDVMRTLVGKVKEGDVAAKNLMQRWAQYQDEFARGVEDISSPLGSIEFVRDGDTVSVALSSLAEPLRGTSVGMHMYMNLLTDALEQGAKRFTSDSTVSREAQRVWESMAKRGINVRLNPAAVIDPVDGALYTQGSGPVFEVLADNIVDKNALPKMKKMMKVLEKQKEDYLKAAEEIGSRELQQQRVQELQQTIERIRNSRNLGR